MPSNGWVRQVRQRPVVLAARASGTDDRRVERDGVHADGRHRLARAAVVRADGLRRRVFVMQLLSAVVVTSLQTCSAEQKMVDQIDAEREKRRIEAGGNPDDKEGDAMDEIGEDLEDEQIPGGCPEDGAAAHAGGVQDRRERKVQQLYPRGHRAQHHRHDDAALPRSSEFKDANAIMEYCFNGVFIAEFVIKHLGYGLGGYWSVGWNRLDGFVVISSVVDMAGSAINLGFIRALRVLRVVRTVRVLKSGARGDGGDHGDGHVARVQTGFLSCGSSSC